MMIYIMCKLELRLLNLILFVLMLRNVYPLYLVTTEIELYMREMRDIVK